MKFSRQFDQMDCGPACVRMVASYYGKDYPLSYLRSLAHLTRRAPSHRHEQCHLRDVVGTIIHRLPPSSHFVLGSKSLCRIRKVKGAISAESTL